MDLLRDIGTNDQLIATRTENQLLKAKVESLSKQVQDLTLQVAVLQAEVEIYRDEARSSATCTEISSSNPSHNDGVANGGTEARPPFAFQLPSSRTSYCSTPNKAFPDLHGSANPTCVACPTDSSGRTILVTGGADSNICFTPMHCSDDVPDPTSLTPASVHLTAPVVCLDAIENTVPSDIIVAAGTMDGHVHCAVYSNPSEDIGIARTYESSVREDNSALKKHGKYVSSISWSCRCYFHDRSATLEQGYFFASSSSDGTVHIYFVNGPDSCSKQHKLEIRAVESLYFDDAITCLCFTEFTGSGTENDVVLYAYVRNTPHLKVIRMPTHENSTSSIITTLHLNASLVDDHVSFAVLDLKISPDGKYIAAACDNNCHLIIDNRISLNPQPLAIIVRKLYGHSADCYSRPVVAWSNDGQYVYCNTQNESKLCIYSIASGELLEEKNSDTIRQSFGHSRPIKDMRSHRNKTLIVTTSFDRNTILWVPRDE